MAENWVERRFLREQNLNKAEDVWQAASTAIDDACKSFNTFYPAIGKAVFSPQNSHSILVEVTHEATKNVPMDTKRRVRIVFDGRRIAVALDEHSARNYQIEADQERCFLKSGAREITPDELSHLALEDALFTPRNPNLPSSPPPRTGQWS
jgi:hypothetical protein